MLTDLPVPVPAATPILRRLRRAVPASARARLLERRARELGADVLAIGFPVQDSPWAVLVHAALPVEHQARLRDGLAAGGPVLTLDERAFAIWSRGTTASGFRFAERELPPPSPKSSLRRAAGLALDGGSEAALRSLLEQVVSPRTFPPVPPSGSSRSVRAAAALGIAHAAFGAQVAVEPGTGLPSEARAPEQRTRTALKQALAGPLADLGGPIRDELSLLLLPGPFGTRHAWRLLALVPDDAPLAEAARVPERLRAHLGLTTSTDGSLRSPAVLTRAAYAGLLRNRLFPRPLQRLAIRLSAEALIGRDPSADALEGPDWTPDDAVVEAAALIEATAACWSPDARSVDLFDLALGAWPAVTALLRGGDPATCLAALHEALAASPDPAFARVGTAPGRHSWGDALRPDLSRPTGTLASWGPTLLRMQEACLEALP